MRDWFEKLTHREQIALMVLTAVFGFLFFFQLVVIELGEKRASLTSDNAALQEKLGRVDVKVEQLGVLRSGEGRQQINLAQALSQASEAKGLDVRRLQPNNRGEVQIRFEGVPFDRILQFLAEVEGDFSLSVIDASIVSAGRGVNATFRISGS